MCELRHTAETVDILMKIYYQISLLLTRFPPQPYRSAQPYLHHRKAPNPSEEGKSLSAIEDSHRRTCPTEFKIAINFRACVVRHTFTLFFGCFSRLTSIHASETHDRRFAFSHFTFITCLCTNSRMRSCCCSAEPSEWIEIKFSISPFWSNDSVNLR